MWEGSLQAEVCGVAGFFFGQYLSSFMPVSESGRAYHFCLAPSPDSVHCRLFLHEQHLCVVCAEAHLRRHY